jgi:hypothetical protein
MARGKRAFLSDDLKVLTQHERRLFTGRIAVLQLREVL